MNFFSKLGSGFYLRRKVLVEHCFYLLIFYLIINFIICPFYGL